MKSGVRWALNQNGPIRGEHWAADIFTKRPRPKSRMRIMITRNPECLGLSTKSRAAFYPRFPKSVQVFPVLNARIGATAYLRHGGSSSGTEASESPLSDTSPLFTFFWQRPRNLIFNWWIRLIRKRFSWTTGFFHGLEPFVLYTYCSSKECDVLK